ncbi:hypothetical protein [Glycomyces tenuis]|uniref:hypothetical protein n=1 Tax=Glycomyces tenuis TaxID=58116 RepID=UPI0012DE122F|nr:hypothetical protein [Glycomyces tenuis]
MPRTSRPLRVFPIVLRNAGVARVADIAPDPRRITLTGEELREGRMGDGFDTLDMVEPAPQDMRGA